MTRRSEEFCSEQWLEEAERSWHHWRGFRVASLAVGRHVLLQARSDLDLDQWCLLEAMTVLHDWLVGGVFAHAPSPFPASGLHMVMLNDVFIGMWEPRVGGIRVTCHAPDPVPQMLSDLRLAHWRTDHAPPRPPRGTSWVTPPLPRTRPPRARLRRDPT